MLGGCVGGLGCWRKFRVWNAGPWLWVNKTLLSGLWTLLNALYTLLNGTIHTAEWTMHTSRQAMDKSEHAVFRPFPSFACPSCSAEMGKSVKVWSVEYGVWGVSGVS